MTYTANQPKPLFDTVIARLAAETGKEVGDAAQPPNPSTTPHYVVYPLPDEASDGTLADPDSDVWWRWQVTAVGRTRVEAQAAQGAARTALAGWIPVVVGLSAGKVELASGSGTERDDDVRPPTFFTTDRFRVFTSPT